MTSREAYAFGWVFGTICKAANDYHYGMAMSLACARPYSSNAHIITRACRDGIMTNELHGIVGRALCEINHKPEMDGGSEKVQPLELQGSWQLGYYSAIAGKPFPGDFTIAAARKAKGMTQQQLADQMGVGQDVISRWESGKVTPNNDNMAKLREILE